jgi:hypothetical protein
MIKSLQPRAGHSPQDRCTVTARVTTYWPYSAVTEFLAGARNYNATQPVAMALREVSTKTRRERDARLRGPHRLGTATRHAGIAGALLTTVLGAAAAGTATPVPGPAAPPCSAPGYRQFDFWLGHWDVFDAGSTRRVATADITAVQAGCALRESYRSDTGGGGESLSMYEPRTGLWRQSWVSDHGQIVLIAGRMKRRAITLSGVEYGTANGRLVRGTWSSLPDGVRETAQRSADGGRTWTPWFDIVFRPGAGKG